MIYIKAAIHETMRIYPPVLFVQRRCVKVFLSASEVRDGMLYEFITTPFRSARSRPDWFASQGRAYFHVKGKLNDPFVPAIVPAPT